MWTFRAYGKADFEAMFRLDEICFTPQFRFSRAAMRSFAESKKARVVLAEADGSLAGFCIVHVETVRGKRVGYVLTLDVAPEVRRHGLAKALMERAETAAREASCIAMALHVFVENHAAVRFYERVGYVRVDMAAQFYGKDDAGKGVDAWIYRKPLL